MPFFIERKDTMKTSELTGAALDWAVAKLEGAKLYISYGAACRVGGWIDYSTDWSQGGPIIEREKISIMEECNGTWMGSIGGCTDLDMPLWQEHGPTPLIATMRCYVASKLGDEIDLPRELT
jgi:hypothetical protein